MSQLCCGTLALRPPFHAAFLCPTAAGASRGITFKTLQQPYAASGGTTCSTRPRRQPRGGSLPVSALRGVESFEADFELTEQQSSTLNELLNSDMFCKQVVRDCRLPEGAGVRFTGVLFQPRPWTPTETKGMPAALERQYHGRPDEYTIINVPPVFMFQAKIFQPPRLCAVYERI